MIAWNELSDRLDADPEFRLAARFWTARLRLDVGDDSRRLVFEDGRLARVEACEAGGDCDLFISAPATDWAELLAESPRPFYQDLFGAQLHHEVRLPDDPVAYAAYYPALRRLVQLLGAYRETQ